MVKEAELMPQKKGVSSKLLRSFVSKSLIDSAVMRAFVKLRKMLAAHKDLARKLNAMEKKYDSQFKIVFDAIRQLMTPPEPKRRKIGF